MFEQLKAEICTMLRRLVEQKPGELEDKGSLNSKQMLEEERGLVGGQGVQEDAKDRGQEAGGVVRVRDDLKHVFLSLLLFEM